jgi:hypothetical protein
MQFNNPASTKKTKYDNSTPEKIHGPVAFAPRIRAHFTPAGLLWDFTHSKSGEPSAGWRLPQRQYGRGVWRPA